MDDKSADCIFCKIARGEIPTKMVAENKWAVAFHDLTPQAPVHVVVIPRVHVASLSEANDASMLGELMLLAADVARIQGLSPNGYRTVINTGRHAGQTVKHLHVHVLGGRNMAWPPG